MTIGARNNLLASATKQVIAATAELNTVLAISSEAFLVIRITIIGRSALLAITFFTRMAVSYISALGTKTLFTLDAMRAEKAVIAALFQTVNTSRDALA
jgi:hypothetical protein